ncbi:MAG: tgt queuine tRNA-ribosyltransferase [Ignavibacteria bacterium]|nr:tgt queuine tRNA-ribosyltransferase [Ignavibacteria bacterium]
MENYFKLEHTSKDSKARAGTIETQHGRIETPVFMPVGTQGAVKAVEHRELHELQAKIILGNTYHLYLRPGIEVLEKFGGLHNFSNWTGALLTDSGGYQVFSLQELRKISEEGVEFKSHIDGSKHFFSPEKVVQVQKIIGSDIMMVLDECTPYPATYQQAEQSMELSLLWARRSKNEFVKSGNEKMQRLFGIAQGGMYFDLRRRYIEEMVGIGFDGYAIGGLSVGEPPEMMYDVTGVCAELMPADKPRYLMGVGTPENILEAIEMGIDMFDCVLPTRNARNGQLFTTRGKINIRNAKYKFAEEAIDENLDCYASRNFSLAYLRHLTISGEILGLQLASLQNIAFYLWLVRTAREKILKDEYVSWKKEVLEKL